MVGVSRSDEATALWGSRCQVWAEPVVYDDAGVVTDDAEPGQFLAVCYQTLRLTCMMG